MFLFIIFYLTSIATCFYFYIRVWKFSKNPINATAVGKYREKHKIEIEKIDNTLESSLFHDENDFLPLNSLYYMCLPLANIFFIKSLWGTLSELSGKRK